MKSETKRVLLLERNDNRWQRKKNELLVFFVKKKIKFVDFSNNYISKNKIY